MTSPDWLDITPGDAPLIISLPHTGTDIEPAIVSKLVSPWLARKDTDWWIDRLYDFAAELGATIIRTGISRAVIDVNRDPSGASLYPGQMVTGLCPLTSFDGEALYHQADEPDEAEIRRRRETFFVPYHLALEAAIGRLRKQHRKIVLYDCHSIRSQIPCLFDGILPHLNIGTNSGMSCAADLTALIEQIAARTNFTQVSNGRFKGGWITRYYGKPEEDVHAVQMELACRGYMTEPTLPTPESWPSRYDPEQAEPLRMVLRSILTNVRDWAFGAET